MNSQKKNWLSPQKSRRMQNGDLLSSHSHKKREEKKNFFFVTTHIRIHFILSIFSFHHQHHIVIIKAAGAKAAAVMSRAYHRQIQQTKTLKAMRLFDTKHLLFHRFFMLPIKNSYTCAFWYILYPCTWRVCFFFV